MLTDAEGTMNGSPRIGRKPPPPRDARPVRIAWGTPTSTGAGAGTAPSYWNQQAEPQSRNEFTAEDEPLPESPPLSPLQAYTPSTAETPLPPLQLQYSAEQRSPASSTATPTYLDNSVASAATPALNTTVSALDVTVDGSPQVSTEPTQYKALSMWKGLQEHVKNIKTTCKRRRFKKYKSAVSGREITSHVHEYLLTRPEEKYSRANRGQAEQVAEMLYKQGLIISAHGSKCIRDSKAHLYHISEHGHDGAIGLG